YLHQARECACNRWAVHWRPTRCRPRPHSARRGCGSLAREEGASRPTKAHTFHPFRWSISDCENGGRDEASEGRITEIHLTSSARLRGAVHHPTPHERRVAVDVGWTTPPAAVCSGPAPTRF